MLITYKGINTRSLAQTTVEITKDCYSDIFLELVDRGFIEYNSLYEEMTRKKHPVFNSILEDEYLDILDVTGDSVGSLENAMKILNQFGLLVITEEDYKNAIESDSNDLNIHEFL